VRIISDALQDGHIASLPELPELPALSTQMGSEAAHRVQWINIAFSE
jgi:hypothetical protein